VNIYQLPLRVSAQVNHELRKLATFRQESLSQVTRKALAYGIRELLVQSDFLDAMVQPPQGTTKICTRKKKSK